MSSNATSIGMHQSDQIGVRKNIRIFVVLFPSACSSHHLREGMAVERNKNKNVA